MSPALDLRAIMVERSFKSQSFPVRVGWFLGKSGTVAGSAKCRFASRVDLVERARDVTNLAQRGRRQDQPSCCSL